ncbi:MAG TPA: NADP-dependent oxidoreductase [Solirubrobacteraceae bacterium]|nr:NADP-dependent oxidoreductase [Solirubrobacteraceae bacterium]
MRFERYGGVEVLDVVEVDPPEPGDGQLLVRVRAAGINPFEAKLRSGAFEGSIPLSFPAAQGNDFAGVVEEVAADVQEFRVGDQVLGTTAVRGSHGELAVASQAHVLARPAALPWEVAGGLWNVGTTAYASVAATGVQAGEVVLVAGASGGVGGLAAQLARHRGATVLGIAGERGHPWLRSRGIVPVAYGDGMQQRLERAAAAHGGRIDALIDAAGHGYVEMGIGLGVAAERINTLVDYEGAARHGARTDGARAAANTEVVEEVVQLIVGGELELPIAATFPLESVREAYELLEHGHPPGKIVLLP